MWQQLGDVALEEGDIAIAERCAAALGDISRARFLHKVRAGGRGWANGKGAPLIISLFLFYLARLIVFLCCARYGTSRALRRD